jgi:hypothetical protein
MRLEVSIWSINSPKSLGLILDFPHFHTTGFFQKYERSEQEKIFKIQTILHIYLMYCIGQPSSTTEWEKTPFKPKGSVATS